jgi:D-alanyl-D-alanine carboxypeptidase/D-alanyl-D-alanine-endopeptidase (penicillin-binding protein 4)
MAVLRLARPLAAVVALLILLGGGAFAMVQSGSRGSGAGAPAGAPSTTTATTQPAPASTTTGSAAVALAPPARATTTTIPPPRLPTTTLSPTAALTARLDGALAGSASCLSVEDATGHVVYQHNPDAPLVPASTQKLMVAAAALAALGPNYRFVTKAVAPAAPVGGRIDSLTLVGTGDPLLATPEFIAYQQGQARTAGYPWTSLAALSDALVAAGINSIPGGVQGDDSYLDRLRILPVWPPSYQQQSPVGRLSALGVNQGIDFTTAQQSLAQDPPGYSASELGRLLGLRSLAVGPSGGDRTAPSGGVVVALVSSAPLSQIVQSMLRASDNWIAELLTRAIDRAAGGTGTTAGGIAVIVRQATMLAIPLVGVRMDDGSGLSHTDRATCRELLAVLDLAQQPAFSPILGGLPVAASTGTLAARYHHTPAAGRLQAKTGWIDNGGGMVGVLSVGPTVRFAFLDNDVQTEGGLLAKEDRVVAVLGGYG